MKTPTTDEVIQNTRRLQEGQHLKLQGCSFLCEHCGAEHTPRLPLVLNAYIAEMDAFQREHLECKPEALP